MKYSIVRVQMDSKKIPLLKTNAGFFLILFSTRHFLLSAAMLVSVRVISNAAAIRANILQPHAIFAWRDGA